MKVIVLLIALTGIALAAEPTVYFKDQFDDGKAWEERWIHSTAKGAEAGKFQLTAGKFYGDAEKDQGIQTSADAKFYHLSAKFEPFSNEGKTLVLQFTVKHEQKIDCGGGYIKGTALEFCFAACLDYDRPELSAREFTAYNLVDLCMHRLDSEQDKLFPKDVDQKKMNGDSKYFVMFGPDICGYSTKKVHVIFNYKGNNLLTKKEITCKDDEFTHVYTLIVRPDNTYEVKIDNERVEGGDLEADWDFLPAKMIDDPNEKKPSDWDDHKKIDDESDVKPEDWEKPEHIPDPDAEKPEDWDDEVDGEWEPPMIDNPDYKGEWKPRQIDNPAYKGEWVHPQIANPEYSADDKLYQYSDIGAIGFDLWQVKSGTIFDNILVTDDVEYAEKFAQDTWGQTKGPEKEMKDKQDEEERKAREAEEAEKKVKEDAEKAEEEEEDGESNEEEAEPEADAEAESEEATSEKDAESEEATTEKDEL